jgi:hypothetical protein
VAVLAGITALALGLRVALAPGQPLRLDESTTITQARLPLGDLVRSLMEGDVHVPLYLVVMHWWIPVAGDSVWALRLPSVLLGAAAVPLLFAVARQLVSEQSAYVTAALGAVAPLWVWHSAEARMYPLLVVTCLAAMALLFEAVEYGRWYLWVGYSLATAASFYTHYYALLMVPLYAAWVCLWRPGLLALTSWAASFGAAVAMFEPWLVLLYAYRLRTDSGGFTNSAADAPASHGLLGLIYGIVAFVCVLAVGYLAAGTLHVLTVLVVGCWPLAVLGLVTARRLGSHLRRDRALFAVVWVVLLVGGGYMIDQVRPGAWHPRYLIMATVPILIGIAALLVRLARLPWVAGAAGVILLMPVSFAANASTGHPMHEDFRSAAALLDREVAQGDVVLVVPGFDATPLAYYLSPEVQARAELVRVSKPEQAEPDDLARIAMKYPGSTLWVVWGPYGRTALGPDGPVGATLDAYKQEHSARVGFNIRVDAFRLPRAP